MKLARSWLARWGVTGVLWVGLTVAYVYSFPYFSLIQSANELPRIYLVMAMVDEGRFAIDTGIRRWGTTADVSPSGDHQYSNKAPGSSMLAIPAYAALKAVDAVAGTTPTLAEVVWVCRLWTGIVPTLLFAALLWRFLARWAPEPATRRLVIIGYALGSMAMTYSVLFISHQLSAVLIATAWILTVWTLEDAGDPIWMLAAGLAAGAAPLVDYQAALAGVPVALWAVVRLRRDRRRWRVVAYAIAGAAIPIAILLWYHDAAFGSPFRTGYAASETFAHFHQKGLLGLDRLRAEAFVGSTVAPDNGLFLLCPMLLLALPGWWLLARHPRERGQAAVTLAVAVIYLLFVSSLNFWRGGWQMGPRYVTAMLPFWLPAVAAAAASTERRWWTRGVAVGLVAVGVVIYAVSCAVYPHFPVQFPNPIYEITFRLLGDGHAPWNLGWLVGLRGTASLVPYLLVVGGLLVWAALPQRRAWRSALLGAAIAAVILVAYGAFPRGGPAEDADYRRWVAGAMPRL